MDFKTLIEQITQAFYNLTARQKIVIALSIAAVIGFIAFLIIYKGTKDSSDGYSILFDKISASDSALVIQQLEQDNVPYKIVNEGTIKVPSDVVYKERIAIASLGIPKDSKVGFELFDKQEFGETDFQQKIKYLRALEGELARTIEALEPIDGASVHAALPKESVFVEKETLPSASVLLKIRPGMKLTSRQISGIKNLISASIPKLTPENVKIVNQRGEPLGASDEAFQSELVAAQVKYKRDYEKAYENKIEKVLAPVLGGSNKVVAKVNINFNFAREDIVSEYFDPESVPRSEQSIEEKREGTTPQETGGVPGAISNIGPVQGIESNKETQKYEKSTTTVNYEISKKVTNIKGEFAKIKRVTAAVVVDGKYQKKKDDEGNELDETEYVALDPAEVEAITNIVKQSVGFDQTRGDEVTVNNFEFKPLSVAKKVTPAKDFINQVNNYVGPLGPILKFIFAGILLFIFYKKVIVPFSEKMLETIEVEAEGEKPELAEEEENVDTLEKFQSAKKKIEDELGISEDINENELKYDVLLEKIKDAIEEKPEDIANLLQSMLKDERLFGHEQES